VKRRRREPATTRPSHSRIEQIVATDRGVDTSRRRGRRYSTMNSPHERDEGTNRPEAPNAVVDQGARDAEAGSVDTDCYGAVGERFDRRQQR
jgi:hypothetical protein